MISLFRQLDLNQKKFVSVCFIFSLLITLDYACIRPVIGSIFITQHGSKTLPYIWLLSLPVNFLIVSFFNHLQGKLGSIRVAKLLPVAIILINTICATFVFKHPLISLIFYIWKDLYILLMFQQLWSQIHSSLGSSKAKHLYSLMYLFGALGSIAGSSIPALLSQKPETYLFISCLIYPLIYFVQNLLTRNPLHAPFEKKESPNPLDGVKQIIKSPELLTIGLLVALMQIFSALSEFIFSKHLELEFSNVVDRTHASARVMSIMHLVTLSLQVFFSIFSVQRLGIYKGHLLIPLFTSLLSAFYCIFPGFKASSVHYVGTRSLDFSLFSVLKESLYAPLKKEHQYEAKSFIDIFVYRGAKTFASIGLILFSSVYSSFIVGIILFVLSILWIYLVKRRLSTSFN